jgi:hypothetical protein
MSKLISTHSYEDLISNLLAFSSFSFTTIEDNKRRGWDGYRCFGLWLQLSTPSNDARLEFSTFDFLKQQLPNKQQHQHQREVFKFYVD